MIGTGLGIGLGIGIGIPSIRQKYRQNATFETLCLIYKVWGGKYFDKNEIKCHILSIKLKNTFTLRSCCVMLEQKELMAQCRF